MKHVLILGGGVMQTPAINAGREMGWRITIADGNADCVARPSADHFLHIDLRDHKALARSAALLRPTLDGVFTAGTDFSYAVAFIAEALHLPGNSVESALNATDKHRMRTRFEEQGIPIPRFSGIEPGLSDAGVRLEAEKIGFPLVVKPVDNMGARGVVRVDAPDTLESAVQAARNHSRSGTVVLEQFVDGPEFSIDALVYDGETYITGIANRHIYFPPYFIEMGHTIPAEENESIVQSLTSVFTRGVRALGISHGAAKGDVFFSESGPVVGEIAARLSGGYMSGWTYPNASGVNLSRIALRLSVGIRPSTADLNSGVSMWSAERALVSIPGTVREVVNNATGFPDVTDIFLRAEPGMEVNLPKNNVEKVANVISRSATRIKAIAAAESSLAHIEVNLVAPSERTEQFLYGEGPSSVFRPYSLSNEPEKVLIPYQGDIRRIAEIFVRSGALPFIDRTRSVISRYTGPSVDAVIDTLTASGRIQRAESPALDGIFWYAFLSGGRQGIQYVYDCFHTDRTENGTIECIRRIENAYFSPS